MSCRQCRGVERLFDTRLARRELRRFRRRGPSRTTRTLLSLLRAGDLDGSTLLDVGGGVGAIHHVLLDAGVAGATHVDASSAYLAVAREEAARLGHADRVRFVAGDLVEVAAALEPADVVTLDRVICCYDDMRALVTRSAALARWRYGLVFPRDTWWVRAGTRAANAAFAVGRSLYRMYVHPTRDVDATVNALGLRLVSCRIGLVWQVRVYERAA